MALDDEAIYDTCEKGVRSSRDQSMTLGVDEILGVLSDKHGKVRPGTSGGKAMYYGVNHVVLTVGETHFKETKAPHFEFSKIAIQVMVIFKFCVCQTVSKFEL